MRIHALFFICVVAVVAGGAEPTPVQKEQITRDIEQRQKARLEQVENDDRFVTNLSPAHIYGRVLDQNGNPVPDAEIKIVWLEYRAYPDQGQHVWIKADARGEWDFTINKPKELSITEVKKAGYDSSQLGQPTFNYTEDEPRPDISKGSPLVLHLRKKGETRCLLGFSSSFMVKVPGGTNYYDYVLGKGATSEQMDRDINADMKPDLMFRAVYSVAAGMWVVSFSTLNTNDGVVAKHPIAYEAPAEGYVREINFKVTDRNSLKDVKCLYLKGRNGAIHTRIEVVSVNADDRFISIGFRALTNPYGDRILEKESDLPWKVERQLKEDAVAALSDGRLPAKPDLAKIKAEIAEKK